MTRAELSAARLWVRSWRLSARVVRREVCGYGCGRWGVSVWATRRAAPWCGRKGRVGVAGVLHFAAGVSLPGWAVHQWEGRS